MSNPSPKKKKYFEHGLAHTAKNKERLKSLAKNVKALRKERGLTQVELANKTGCSRQMVNNIEAELNFPSTPVYFELCDSLDAGKPPLI